MLGGHMPDGLLKTKNGKPDQDEIDMMDGENLEEGGSIMGEDKIP